MVLTFDYHNDTKTMNRRTDWREEEFIENYLKPKLYVIFTDLVRLYITQNGRLDNEANHGDLEMPLIDKNYHDRRDIFR
jgi:hypothetical protein